MDKPSRLTTFAKEYLGEVLLDEAAIEQGTEQVAEKLNQQFAGEDEVVVITVVPGGLLFTADLVRKLAFDVKMDVISCPHTPGERANTSTIAYLNNIDIQDKHVVVIDDAIESGGTMKRLVAHLCQQFSPRSVNVATLFVKPGRVAFDVPLFFAFELEDDSPTVGYGLPWHDKLRNLPRVYRLKPH